MKFSVDNSLPIQLARRFVDLGHGSQHVVQLGLDERLQTSMSGGDASGQRIVELI